MSIEALVYVLYGPAVSGARNVSTNDTNRVLMMLAEHSDAFGRGACPSQQTMAESLKLNRRTVRNALDALVAQGRITETAPAIPRVRGTTYAVAMKLDHERDSGGQSTPESDAPVRKPEPTTGHMPQPCRTPVSAEPPDSGVNTTPESADSGGELRRVLGRGTQAGNPRHDPEPVEPEPTDNGRVVASQPTRTPWRVSWITLIEEGLALVGQTTTPGNVGGFARVLRAVEHEHGADQAGNVLIDFLHATAEGVSPLAASEEVSGEYFGLVEQWQTRTQWADDLWSPFVWQGHELIRSQPPPTRHHFDRCLDVFADDVIDVRETRDGS